MSDFGYTYKGLMRWLAEGRRTYEDLDKVMDECITKKRDMTTTNTLVIEINRVLDVCYALQLVEVSAREREEEESDCEGDPS